MRRFAALLVAAACLPAAISTSGAAAAGCPDEALRVGPSALLPGCRAYEMVSPVDKHGGNVTDVLGVRAAPSGEAVSFYSTTAFADSAANPLGTAYLAKRGPNWGTKGVDPPQENPKGLLLYTSAAGSSDQGVTLQASKVALTPGATPGGSNVYLRDNATGARTLIATAPGNDLFQHFAGAGGGFYIGASADWNHILIHSTVPLIEDPELEAGVEHFYEWSAGAGLRVADVLPDGRVPSEGTRFNIGAGAAYQHRISTDGRRIFFEAMNEAGQYGLYLREGGATRAISVPAGTHPEEAEQGEYEGASADGSLVFFVSYLELVPGEETQGSPTLYRYDVDTETLTDMTRTNEPSGASVGEVMGMSSDGSYVYFSAVAALTPDASLAEPGFTTNFYLAHGDSLDWIGQTQSGVGEFAFATQYLVSPNGRYFAFASLSEMTPEDAPSPLCYGDPVDEIGPEDCLDVFVYDAATGVLACASCNGELGRGNSDLGGQENHEAGLGDEYPHAVLDDGTVFMDTPNKLLSGDANGVDDVYAWRAGVDQLVSTGHDPQPSTFGDASPDGSNVFFLTAQRLVGQDTDRSVDVYDDREGGGLASQYPPGAPGACEGEGCRGAGPSAPAGLVHGSVFAGQQCEGFSTAARRAAAHVRRLQKQARQAGHRRGAKAKAKARRLRHEASSASSRAKRLKREANTCGRAN